MSEVELESGSWHVVQARYARGKTGEQERDKGRVKRWRPREKFDDGTRGDNHGIRRNHFRTNEDDMQHPKTRLPNGHSRESAEQETLQSACEPVLQKNNCLKDDAIILEKVGLPFRTREGFTSQNNEWRRSRREDVRDRSGRPGEGVMKMERLSGEASKPQLQRGILRIGVGVELHQGEGGRVERVKVEPEFSLQNDQDWPSIARRERKEEGVGASVKSWTMVVKTHPPPLIQRKLNKPPAGDASDSEDEENDTVRKKKKKKKKKGGGEQGAGEQRQAQPLTLELGSMFENLKVQRSTKVVVAAGAPLLHKGPNSKSPIKGLNKQTDGKESAPRNMLDSSAPSMRRGKERETPKKKKPTPLRKVISKEKEEKKKLREQGLPIPVDFDATKEPRSDVELSHSEDESAPETQPTIHNRRFREYCTHITSEDLNACVELLLSELVRFQDRQFLLNPTKAKAKRRYVCGLREVTKHLKLKRLKCIIVPPNLDKIQSTGGINELVSQITALCHEQGVPVVFAMSRRRLAYVLKKKHNIGCVGIFSYEGAEPHYKKLMQLVEEASEEYNSRMSALQQPSNPPEQLCAVTLSDTITPLDNGGREEGLSQGSADTYFSHKSETGFTDEEDEPAHQNGTHSVDPENRNGTHVLGLGHGNGTGFTTQNGSIMKSPWNIFFKSNSSACSTASGRDASQHNGIGTSDGLLIQDLESVGNQTTANSTLPCSNGHPPHTETEFNVNAPAFVPSFKFELNINAAEFIPTTQTQQD